ncbi:MAG: FKBP-type peptidyl-prolyl cis-trans isomerase [Proteobacteria bacterium]|nr:FKBP-type peptidyl-prolyl cis-trans isomerase [Pseudomonadota bacterium]
MFRALVLFSLLACGTPQPTEPTPIPETEFAEALSVDLSAMTRSETGLYIQVLEAGSGDPSVSGDALGIEYTVWRPDGTQLDANRPGAPLKMVLGESKLIAGWIEGVTGMRLGEKRKLVLPYDLAYGEEGRPPRVPPFSTLIFEVKLATHTAGEVSE